eukprot:TRINITY_DN6930_c0_g2_i2.p1 TRINITY_DN6930_c0_g2~~TRINITY_DN6930_c0_g2_i2.p1  ORF type:complete len:838 (+),score=153.37 TRINITY_DN6930_c0_g2_i2:298-2514(+)
MHGDSIAASESHKSRGASFSARARSKSFIAPKQSVDESSNDRSGGTFLDAAAMKEKVRAKLVKPKYDVSMYYKDSGLLRDIATNSYFEQITLLMISANALWIAIDTDLNDDEVLVYAHPVFQTAENVFCAFFAGEWVIRLASFRNKLDGFKDAWFVFDGIMVSMMILETWVFNACIVLFATSSDGPPGGIGGGSILRIARLLRLSRMCRMVRLLRAMPELFVMLKGLLAASRSVFFTLLLLAGLQFVFGIAFTQLARPSPLGPELFPTVLDSMYVLLVHGTLLLSTDGKALQIGATTDGFYLNALFFAFILLAAVLLMNMLIGVLCEVVSAVAAAEKEEMLVNYTGVKLRKVVALIDEDGGGTISRDEFMLILQSQEAIEALQDVGVDVIGLVDFADFIFGDECDEEDSSEGVELTLAEFMEVVLQLRGSNSATVKDIVDLRKFVQTSITSTNDRIQRIERRLEEVGQMVKEMVCALLDVKATATREKKPHLFREQKSNAKEQLPEELAHPETLNSCLGKYLDPPIKRPDMPPPPRLAPSIPWTRPPTLMRAGSLPRDVQVPGVSGIPGTAMPTFSEAYKRESGSWYGRPRGDVGLGAQLEDSVAREKIGSPSCKENGDKGAHSAPAPHLVPLPLRFRNGYLSDDDQALRFPVTSLCDKEKEFSPSEPCQRGPASFLEGIWHAVKVPELLFLERPKKESTVEAGALKLSLADGSLFSIDNKGVEETTFYGGMKPTARL